MQFSTVASTVAYTCPPCYEELFIVDNNPPNGAILLATFRQGDHNHWTGITAITPLYFNTCDLLQDFSYFA